MGRRVFETDRLTIRPWYRDEAERLLEIRSIPDVAKWLADPNAWDTIEQALDAIASWKARIDSAGPLGHWAVVPHGQTPVGAVSLQMTPDGEETTIGWYLDPECSGQGWATEAAKALVQYGLESEDRIWAMMLQENDASVRVAEAIGMTDLGVVDDRWYGGLDEPASRMFCAYANTPPSGV